MQCLDWEVQCCDANVLLLVCSIPISKARNKANKRKSVEAFWALPRLHFETLSFDSFL